MAKITRKTQKIFGGNSSNNAQFGSARAGTFVLDNDPDVIQSLSAWGAGINAATVSGEKLPALEESQGVHYVETRQLSYILQEGIPEWDSGTTYFTSSLVKAVNSVIVYRSLIDENTSNPLSDPMSWRMVCDFDTVQPLNNYNATTAPTATDDNTLGYYAGSYWFDTVGSDTYFCVDATTGAAVWVLQSSIDPSDLGTAAFVNTGTSSGQVPLNSNLGAAAYVGIAAGGSGNLLRVDGSASSLTDMPDIGVGQTWQDMTASRLYDTVYTNSTGKPIQLGITISPSSGSFFADVFINGVNIARVEKPGTTGQTISIPINYIIPNGTTYRITYSGTISSTKWFELR